MKKFYTSVIALFLICIFAFIYSFVYLDRNKHKTYYYIVNKDGCDIGLIKVDKFITDDKVIYISSLNAPLFPVFTHTKTRLDMDKRYSLESYSREDRNGDFAETIRLENRDNLLRFLGIFDSEFRFLDGMPIKKETFVFDEESPVLYMPLIDNYNFRLGRSQAFNAVSCPGPALPPARCLVIFTSVKDEYLKIESRKIKTENLIVKIKNYPQAAIWVAKSDRCLIRLAIPKKGLKITRTFSPKELEAKDYRDTSKAYTVKDVAFKNKSVELAGVLTTPAAKKEKNPGVLIIAGRGPQDRFYKGFSFSILDYLSNHGFCVLAFDKRGVGSSKGNNSSVASEDEYDDVNAALDYLVSQETVDPDRVAIIAHSDGIINAFRASVGNSKVAALVLISPRPFTVMGQTDNTDRINDMSILNGWSDDYTKLVTRTVRDTYQKANATTRNWAYIMGKRCFLKNLKASDRVDIAEAMKKTTQPVLILQGKEDDEILPKDTTFIEKTLGETAGANHAIRYYSYLGHYLGGMVNDGIHKMHYRVDKEVLENIKSWLVKVLQERPARPADAAAETANAG